MQNEIFYVNANIRNNEDTYQLATYNEVRKSPLISGDVETWQMAIARFSVSTNTIPLWIPHIDTSNPTGNPDQTIYKITITDTNGGIVAQAPIVWKPQVKQVPKPGNVSPGIPQVFSEYYYAYTIDHFVDLFNETLQTIKGQFPSIPHLVFQEGKFHLFADAQDWDSTFGHYRLYFNEPLGHLLSAFPISTKNPRTPDLFSQIEFKSLGTNVFTKAPGFDENANPSYEPIPLYLPTDSSPSALVDRVYRMSQEFGSLAKFQVFRGIVFTTSQIPIRSEAVSSTTPYGTSTNDTQQMSDASATVLADMDCVVDDTSAINQSILQYSPPFYHFINLKGARDLQQIQFSVFWKDDYGNYHPLYLRHGSVTAKLMFCRR